MSCNNTNHQNDDRVKIGFIGAGNMAQAIGFSIIEKGEAKVEDIMVSAPSFRNLMLWKKRGVQVTTNNCDVVAKCSIIFLAMKPQFLDEALLSLCNVERKHPVVFISIIVGVTISTLKKKFVKYFKWYDEYSVGFVRVMPNTPVAVGAGCYLVSFENAFVTKTAWEEGDFERKIKRILSTGGFYEIIDENQFNSLSGLSGSGPAYMYLIIEALSDGAVKVGAPRDLAIRLAAQTMIGAGQMVLHSGKHPAELKDKVCSPGGTTIAAMHALERASVRGALMSAVEEAFKRGEEIKQLVQTKT